MGNVLRFIQKYFLFTLTFHGVFCPCAQIHKQDFMLPVAKHPFVILPALFVLVQYPERDTDIGGDKQFSRKNDNGFHLIILNQFFANL